MIRNMKVSFFSTRSQKERFLVLDLSNASFDSALGEKGSDEKLRMLSLERREVATLSFERTLEYLYLEIQKFQPHKIIFSFPSPMLKAKFVTQVFRPTNPKIPIQRREKEFIEKTVLKGALQEMRASLSADSGILPEDFVRVDLSVKEIKVDGYVVSSLEGLKGSRIEFMFLGIFLLRSYGTILQRFTQKYRIRTFKILHPAQAVENFAQKTQKGGLYLDIEDETSQIFAIRDGRLSFASSIPMGGDHFTEIFVESLGMKKNIAREFQEKYFRGMISEELRTKLKALLLPAVKNFATLVKKQLRDIEGVFSPRIFMFGRGSFLKEIHEIFEGDDLKNLPFSRVPEVSFLYPKDVRSIDTPHKTNPQYTLLFLLIPE